MPPRAKAKTETPKEGAEQADTSVKKKDGQFTKHDPYYKALDTALTKMLPKGVKYDKDGRVLPMKEQTIALGEKQYLQGPNAVELACAMDGFDYDFNKLPHNMKLKLENAESLFPQYFAALRKTILAFRLDPDAEHDGKSVYNGQKYTIPVKDGAAISRVNTMTVSKNNFFEPKNGTKKSESKATGGTKRKRTQAAKGGRQAKAAKKTPKRAKDEDSDGYEGSSGYEESEEEPTPKNPKLEDVPKFPGMPRNLVGFRIDLPSNVLAITNHALEEVDQKQAFEAYMKNQDRPLWEFHQYFSLKTLPGVYPPLHYNIKQRILDYKPTTNVADQFPPPWDKKFFADPAFVDEHHMTRGFKNLTLVGKLFTIAKTFDVKTDDREAMSLFDVELFVLQSFVKQWDNFMEKKRNVQVQAPLKDMGFMPSEGAHKADASKDAGAPSMDQGLDGTVESEADGNETRPQRTTRYAKPRQLVSKAARTGPPSSQNPVKIDPEADKSEADQSEGSEYLPSESEAGDAEAGDAETIEVEGGETEADETEAGETETGETDVSEYQPSESDADEI